MSICLRRMADYFTNLGYNLGLSMANYEARSIIARVTYTAEVPFVEQAILTPLTGAAFLKPTGFRLFKNSEFQELFHQLKNKRDLTSLEVTAQMEEEGDLVIEDQVKGKVLKRLPHLNSESESIAWENATTLYLAVWAQNSELMNQCLRNLKDQRFIFLNYQ